MTARRIVVAVLILIAPFGCAGPRTASGTVHPGGETRGGLAAVGIVTGADAAATGTPRFVPLAATMPADVELLSGHPDSAGRPFVMRIRELAGTVIPAHRHPVDEHLTVLRGTIPSIYYSTLLHDDYHTANDVPERIDYAKLTRMAQWMYLTGWYVANAPRRPAPDPGAQLER